MKAAICTKYGSPEFVKIEEIEKPTPKDNEILIHVIATSVQTGDCKVRDMINTAKKEKYNPIMKLLMRILMGYNKPKNPILGMELFGKIEFIGKNVTKHKIGDEIIVMTDMKMGAHSEYIVWKEGKLVINKPNNLTPEQAAALCFGGTTALYFFRKANIQKEQSILIYGASGAVGTSAVQLAKYYGAIVTGVCGTKNIELIKSLGADYVIDYTKEDIRNSKIQYDIVFDTIGKITKKECDKIIKLNGKYITVRRGMVMGKQEDINFLKTLAEENKYTVIIDKIYGLNEIVEAYKYVETGHKKGNIVLKM